MPDATITSTASTFGTISGTFAADQSTVTGTVTAIIPGTLSGSVGVPGPAGVGVPAGGSAGMVLAKVDGVDYNTEWINVDPSTSWGEITGTLSDQTDLQSALNLKAPLASPVFTGDARAVTAALGDNDTSIATTAFVQQELLSGTANAKNLEVYVRNQTGSTLAAGTIVYVNGATGNRPTVTPAQANNDANSAQTMGFVKTSIANNGFGYVIVRGELENIDTSALTEGVQLYLSPTTAGTWTTTKPSAPQHLVYVGIVIRAHPTQGVILVAVQNGYELNELHDVQITTPTNGQVLKYDAATNLWKNQTDLNSGVWGSITGTLSAQTDLQSALDAKANLASPVFTGDPRSVTPSLSDNDTSIATTAFVKGQGYATTSALSAYAPLAGATFTGDVTCQTKLVTPQDSNAPVSVTQGQIWHDGTANFYVGTYTDTQDRIILLGELNSTLSNYAPKASPVFIGNPTAPTPATSDNDTSIATTAFVKAQGYITSSALTGYATESWVTTALGSYLTTATAASTYQTQAGMSSYLTTSAAASTYLTQSNAATTYYPLSSNPAGYLTSAPVTSVAGKTGAVTLAVADVSGAAPLASPTFTGTPSLPTGTTAVTQAAGNNTTAVATTAFVQTSNPDASTTVKGHVELATLPEIIAGTSSALVVPVSSIPSALADPNLRSLQYITGTSVSGSGTVTSAGVGVGIREMYLASLSTGRAAFLWGSAGTNASPLYSTGDWQRVDFSKKIWVSGRTVFGTTDFGTSYLGDSNTIARITFCGYSGATTGDMTQKGIGLKKVGGVASTISLTVHNGTTLTDVSTTKACADNEAINWTIYSDGTGNVTLYINGTEAATTSSGPTGLTTDKFAGYREQIEATTTPGVRGIIEASGGWIYIQG